MPTLSDVWKSTEAALRPEWRLEGLRCTSTGLTPDRRGDRWVAEACGPSGACVKVESGQPEDALASLGDRVQKLMGCRAPRRVRR
jgi:hypothetical protein